MQNILVIYSNYLNNLPEKVKVASPEYCEALKSSPYSRAYNIIGYIKSRKKLLHR